MTQVENDTPLDQTTDTPEADRADTAPATELETLRAERDDARERLLRLQAEFDNYRKRMDRQRRELHDHFAMDVLGDFLPVLDDLERALDAARASNDPALTSHRQGLELVHKQFVDLLKRHQVQPIDALGAPFDPNVHEAVSQEPSDTHDEGQVIAELRRGYRVGDRLLRAAMVKVATRG